MEQKLVTIGYVAAIEYNSEGTIIEWLYNKKGKLSGYSEFPRVFKTEEAAKKFIDGKEHVGKPYIRTWNKWEATK